MTLFGQKTADVQEKMQKAVWDILNFLVPKSRGQAVLKLNLESTLPTILPKAEDQRAFENWVRERLGLQVEERARPESGMV